MDMQVRALKALTFLYYFCILYTAIRKEVCFMYQGEFSSMPESRPIRDIAYDRLKHAIITGELPAGSRIVETTFADQLHISRTPLREALRKLERDGLVEYVLRLEADRIILNLDGIYTTDGQNLSIGSRLSCFIPNVDNAAVSIDGKHNCCANLVAHRRCGFFQDVVTLRQVGALIPIVTVLSHLVPMNRGILATEYATLKKDVTYEERCIMKLMIVNMRLLLL